MMNNKIYNVFLILFLISGCSNDNREDILTTEENTQISKAIEDHYFLINDAGANRVYLINKAKENIFEWELEAGIGNDCYLLDNGQLLAILQAEDPYIDFGGYGGKIQLINPDFSVAWEFILSSQNQIAHHDIEMLPNGNILAIVWVRKSTEESKAVGFKGDYPVFPERLIEINPDTNEIVWQWDSWDHLIQDHDRSKPNYGIVSDHPGKIDINYSMVPNGDIMHANGLDYDPENDLIYLSVNFFSEIWVIDHSTSTAQAKTERGGNFDKGGELIYRFGNPEAYQNQAGSRLFYNVHFPNFITENGQNKMLVFMNGSNTEQSYVYEFKLDYPPVLIPANNNEPELLWEYTQPGIYSGKVSGAELLANGNILITVGNYGLIEVDRMGEILWEMKESGFFWRTYSYHKDSPAIKNLNIE
ncbi:aryl-sulfate sulfotransferase [Christiangramia sabulilitoris]|uniref:Arylsulfotransferase (ASST) n=1 Tax=Christiangramia sabulilitoris TaxID=2583991 RepID=A0A550I417_9FLAO|nr:aryl-sulfate sulfotransferase [Christiangramia sabulilitoris]TRO65699.1 hypothetical protein FGM01_09895 [Christiangramia sabulilitoris]